MRWLLRCAVLPFSLSVLALPASAQTHPGLQKQLERLDFGITAAGILNSSTSGKIIPTAAPDFGGTLVDNPSNTVGVGVTLRYVARPYFGLEANFGYARYTQNYSGTTGVLPSFGVQNNADEYTLGYLVTPPHPIFGFSPYASAGSGTIAFKPTRGGGDDLQTQARQTYYYNVGLQQAQLFGSHFGVRAGFRQLFTLAPDFGQNYLTDKQRMTTSEPYFGFYLHY